MSKIINIKIFKILYYYTTIVYFLPLNRIHRGERKPYCRKKRKKRKTETKTPKREDDVVMMILMMMIPLQRCCKNLKNTMIAECHQSNQ